MYILTFKRLLWRNALSIGASLFKYAWNICFLLIYMTVTQNAFKLRNGNQLFWIKKKTHLYNNFNALQANYSVCE